MKLAVERLPMRVVQRRAAKPGDQVPAGAVKVFLGEENQSRIVSTPEALREVVLPLSGNSENLPAGNPAPPQSTNTPEP
jgi:hypothetical protein